MSQQVRKGIFINSKTFTTCKANKQKVLQKQKQTKNKQKTIKNKISLINRT